MAKTDNDSYMSMTNSANFQRICIKLNTLVFFESVTVKPNLQCAFQFLFLAFFALCEVVFFFELRRRKIVNDDVS